MQDVLTNRNEYIGGSEAASALGLSRYNTMLGLWAEKTGQIVSEQSDSIAAEVGKELEDYVARKFTEATGLQVEKVDEAFIHPEYNFLRAHIDRRVIGENSILECKTCSVRKAQEWIDDEIPQEYIIQVMHYLMVTGAQYGYIAVLIGNEQFKWKIIERDESAIQQILEGEKRFWNEFVIPRVMPMMITANDSSVLSALFPYSESDLQVELDDTTNQLIELRNASVLDKYSLETQIETLENQIKARLGNAERAESIAFRVAWKTQMTIRLNTERLKKERPNIYEEYVESKPSRRLTIKAKVIGERTNDSNEN
jgi:putative phage-type endonuclease